MRTVTITVNATIVWANHTLGKKPILYTGVIHDGKIGPTPGFTITETQPQYNLDIALSLWS